MAKAGLPMRLDPERARYALSSRCRLAQRRAGSSRSLPQNNSPSAVVKLGAPNRPRCCASSVCARSRALLASERGRGEHGLRVDLQACKHLADRAGIVDPAAVAELCAEQRDAKRLAPAVVERRQRDPRRQQAVLGKGIGAAERHVQVRAQPLEVAPHMPAFRRIEIERRGGPALRLEDRPQQERAKAHPHAGVCGQRPDPHRRRVGIGRGEIEPEIEPGRTSGDISGPMSKFALFCGTSDANVERYQRGKARI